MPVNNISVVGIVGVPANYGGFETLTENLVRFHHANSLRSSLAVYCSAKKYARRPTDYLSASLRYLPLDANGAQSILYDVLSLVSSIRHGADVILLLGVSGAIALPAIRLFSSAKIVTNIDGIEWRREKWSGLAKRFLRFSEKLAVRYSHEVIADNGAIAEYVERTYGKGCHVIAYGGDHALSAEPAAVDETALPDRYALSVCRIEPENNVAMIVEAFAGLKELPLVMVGNWEHSDYGRAVRRRYGDCGNVVLLDPIYDLGKLRTLRSRASLYVHGHSAGGTNPSLVEAMHFGKAVLAFDCAYNRHTTENKALYFDASKKLAAMAAALDAVEADRIGQQMLEVARRRYTWEIVAGQYFALLNQEGCRSS